MAKIVRYNGGNLSYYSCSDPTNLMVGMEYEVIHVDDRGWQTDYTLKGVDGKFNSCWFDDVSVPSTTYIALAHTVPVVGKSCECFKIEFIEGKPKLVGCKTSTVKSVSYMGNNIYRVTTNNNVYIVQVS